MDVAAHVASRRLLVGFGLLVGACRPTSEVPSEPQEPHATVSDTKDATVGGQDAEPPRGCRSAAEHAELFRSELLLSDDGRQLFVSWRNGRLSLHDPATLDLVSEMQHADEPRWRLVDATPNGHGLIVEAYEKSDSEEHIEYWDLRTNLRRKLPVPQRCSGPSASNRGLLCSSYENLWYWTGFDTGAPQHIRPLLNADQAAVSPDDQQFAGVFSSAGVMPGVGRWERGADRETGHTVLERAPGAPATEDGGFAVTLRINDAGDIALTTVSGSVHRISAGRKHSGVFVGQGEEALVLQADGTVWTIHAHGSRAPIRWAADGTLERFEAGPVPLSGVQLGATATGVLAVGLHGAFRWDRGEAGVREDSWCL